MSEDDNQEDKPDDQPEQPHGREVDTTEGEASRVVPDKKAHDKAKKNRPHLTADDDGASGEGASEHVSLPDENKPEEEASDKNLVIFDFDQTLIEQDSLQMFVADIVGDRFRAYSLSIIALLTTFWESVTTKSEYMDFKSAFKANWLKATIAGTREEDARKIAEAMRDKVDWLDKVVADMKKCADAGYDVLIATGALDFYLPILLRDLPVTAMICSHLEVVDGVITGRLTGPKMKCNAVRREKRVRVQDYINNRGPFNHIIGYGNLPDDGPFLALCDEFFVI